jgi:competence protein ComFC
MNLYHVKRTLLSFIYPNRCPFCERVTEADKFYCPSCAELDFYRNSGGDIFCCVYNDKSKPLITKAKENADGYAISAAAKLLHSALIQNDILGKIDLIAPVPARKASMKQRGYSFPALLAKEIAGLSGKKYMGKLLVLLRETEEQKDLSADERMENLKGAFGIGGMNPHGKNILIIDDISTTGATLNEAKRALSEYAGEVYFAAFAKTATATSPSPP